jgi:putative Ca2+/H+ antiporter (TMEM165/GDT1 family)
VNQAFLISTGAVALAEIGDKTQLLSLVLAARYRKPVPIILGVFTATLVNHACAGALGAWLGSLLTPTIMRWALAASFIAMGLWILVPDKLDDEEANTSRTHFGVFGATVVTFFIAVVAGTTLGMMIANVPAILLGDRFAHRLPTKLVHGIAAVMFVVLGTMALFGIGV